MMRGEKWLETGSPFKKMNKSDVVIGHIYKHSKTRNLYVVTDIANTNSDWPQYVVYADANRKAWARPISEFVEKFEVSKGVINQVGDDMSESQIEWLKAENARLTKENEQLIKDLHRIDAARQAAVSQCAAMAEEIEGLNEGVKALKAALVDYAIWQAITDLESRCRHRSSGLQIEVEDKEHEPVVQAALLILAECGVDVVRDAKFPNIKINYDRSKNQFFGRA